MFTVNLDNLVDDDINNPKCEVFLQWCEEFLAKPNVNLPRPGNVCPFIVPTVKRKLIDYCTFPASEASKTIELKAFILAAFKYWERHIQSRTDENIVLSALIILFDPPKHDTENFQKLKRARKSLEESFLEKGCVSSVFYPGSKDYSVRNNKFIVANAPVPFLFVRKLSKHDRSLLELDEERYIDRIRFLDRTEG